MNKDEIHMSTALSYAHRAKKQGEVPIGAIIIDSSEIIIGIGWNQIETKKSQLAHAEVIAIKQATKNIGDWRLGGCSLYVTLEPCMMCLGLIHLSRISRVFFAALSPVFGIKEFYNKQYANHTCEVIGGVMEKESTALLKDFFKKKRVLV